jgi:hypothetical protein
MKNTNIVTVNSKQVLNICLYFVKTLKIFEFKRKCPVSCTVEPRLAKVTCA